jgi:hypothetical protein
MSLPFSRASALLLLLAARLPAAYAPTDPFVGARIVALPMKIRGGSGAPLRIVAWVPAP